MITTIQLEILSDTLGELISARVGVIAWSGGAVLTTNPVKREQTCKELTQIKLIIDNLRQDQED